VAPEIPFSTLTFTTLTGEKRNFHELGNSPLVVCFAASWCAPCRSELDDLTRVTPDLGEARVVVIGEEPVDRIRLLKEIGEYPFEFLKLRGTFNSLGIHSIPTTYLLDRHGKVVKKMTGAVNWIDRSSRKHLLTLLRS
jgi:thiol-disulfide isomerase/thioredoxin